MGDLDEVQNVMNNWYTYTLVWVGIVIALFFIIILVLIWAKLSSVSRTSKQSFKDLGTKIDSMARTHDAFSELNAKIDNLNKTTIDQKRSTDYISPV